MRHPRPSLRIVLLGAALAGCNAFGQTRSPVPAPEPEAAKACVHLTCPDGARYFLGYADLGSAREGYLPLPLEQYDSVAGWASHSKYTDVVAPLDVYRVYARMATRDDRSEHGNHGNHGLFTRWHEYKWPEYAQAAYGAVTYGLPRASPVRQSLEASLVRLGFAKWKGERLKIGQRKLSAAEKDRLRMLFATTEDALAGEERMRGVKRSIEEFARTCPPENQEDVRQSLGRFRVD
ncbi:MAG: hypothetical protein L0323_21230 [Planctomycetes bacterium]|nr:hypothetical protein [Planctomycetota bacterium]